MASSSLPLLPNLSLLVGPVEAGILANAFATGAFFLQVYIYFTRFSDDKWPYKAVAFVLMALQLAHFISECAVLWDMTVVAMESPVVLLTMTKSMITVMLLTDIVAVVVQLFFVYRLWMISGKSWLPTICGIFLTCLRQVPTYINIARAHAIPEAAEYWSQTRTTLILALVSALVSDICISSIIAYYLWAKRKSGQFATTLQIIDRLILWTVETGLLTCLISSLILILFLAQPSNYIWMSVYAIFGSVYANALVAALNGRWILQRHSNVQIYNANKNASITDEALENSTKRPVIDIRREVEIYPGR